MRTETLVVFLLSLSLPAAGLAETMGFGQPFSGQQQQEQLQQQEQMQQQLQQQQQEQWQQQQLQQQQYQQYQQNPAQPPYQPPAGMPGQQQWTPPQMPASQAPPAGGVPAGPCTVKLSADRSTVHLMDASGSTELKHVSLGQDRVQKVFNSPDGTWSVAIYKIRGAQQYGFIALDLAKCEEQQAVDVPSIASAAAFGQGEVVLTFETGVKRFRLENQVTR